MSRFQNTLDKVACGSKGLRVRSRGSWSMFILSLMPSDVRTKAMPRTQNIEQSLIVEMHPCNDEGCTESEHKGWCLAWICGILLLLICGRWRR